MPGSSSAAGVHGCANQLSLMCSHLTTVRARWNFGMSFIWWVGKMWHYLTAGSYMHQGTSFPINLSDFWIANLVINTKVWMWTSVLVLCKGSVQLSAGTFCPAVPNKCLRIVCMSPWPYTQVSWTWCGKALIDFIFWQIFEVVNELESDLGMYITWHLLILRVLSHFFKERSPTNGLVLLLLLLLIVLHNMTLILSLSFSNYQQHFEYRDFPLTFTLCFMTFQD